MKLINQAILAKQASKQLRTSSNEVRSAVLNAFADYLMTNCKTILKENNVDLNNAKENGIRENMIDRLTLTSERIDSIVQGVKEVALLEDPLNNILEEKTLENGIQLKKISSPMGVIGVIFESRPNVSADVAALCIKAGSSCILKGGKESYHSCLAIVECMKQALKDNGLSSNCVQLANNPTHQEVEEFISNRESLDLLIPRGGKKLIQSVVSNAKVPVIETGAGVCHTYIAQSANYDIAEKIVINAKCQRPSVCNAMETLLVNETFANEHLNGICKAFKENGVTIYADDKSRNIVNDLLEASEESYYTEYNDLILNLKIVSDVQEAIEHIETYGTHHSEAIITSDLKEAEYFMNHIDSACVYMNASTRFTDGYEFGLGAEIGISTQKLHARGPMGLKELTTYTYHLYGKGETR